MTGLAKVALGFVAFLLLVIGVQAFRLRGAQNALADAQLVPQHQAAVAAAAKVDTVREVLQGATQLVTRTIKSIRTDTLVIRPTTAAETVTVVREVPVLVAQLDTLKRACSALSVSCQDYRLAAEKRFAADSVEKVSLTTALHGARPSRFGAAWNAVKLPLAFIGGAYIGSRVVR